MVEEGWDYTNVDEWKKEFPQSCAGSKQSPINIILNNTKLAYTTGLEWKNYDFTPAEMRLTNNGHTIQLQAKWYYYDAYVTSGPLGLNDYIFEQLHFHWGQKDNEGSEHTINGKRCELEIHMVHWKRDYGSIENAVNYSDGLVVIASFYTVLLNRKSQVLENILDAISSVQNVNGTTKIEPFPLSDFKVADNYDDFISYSGSLTTPKCNEVVTWIILLTPFSISKKQIAKFRSIKLNHGSKYNYRSTQPLNDRKIRVYLQFDPKWKNFDTPFLKYKGNKYVFQQLHFHWGRNDQVGSEHTVNKKRYSLEMHMVHWNKNYGSLNEAINHKDGLIVVASFYQVSNVKSVAVQDILDAAEKVEEEGSSWQIENFLLSDFEVVNDKTSWISYNGSLTTPQCLEVVTWLLSLDPYDVTENQIRKIRSLKLSHNDDHDNRPTQPLNGRKITLYTVLFF
ncbi:hypothetical protein HCN44_009206 [Aphidius gifuensis]|uniref:Carbonic anhydrase n=1 Tax=Aphidius gifuensis TaxID=684658 RepID=A0A834Y622_APHGI|nr:hypothetical protein HCN44_009206 [Aphidius gifuensis]